MNISIARLSVIVVLLSAVIICGWVAQGCSKEPDETLVASRVWPMQPPQVVIISQWSKIPEEDNNNGVYRWVKVNGHLAIESLGHWTNESTISLIPETIAAEIEKAGQVEPQH